MAEHDLFISHASEDKESFVRPLAELLQRIGVNVWYDEFTLSVGDSLSRAIDEGLAMSRYGAVVISPNFIAKAWPKRELAGLTAREVGADKVILPIWLDVTFDEMLKFSPTLADKLALNASTGVDRVAIDIIKVVRPDIYARFRARQWLEEAKEGATREDAFPLSKIVKGPIRREHLDPVFVARARLVREALLEVFDVSWIETVDNFRRDISPEPELEIWEVTAGAYLAINNEFQLDKSEKRALFDDLLSCSPGRTPTQMDSRWAGRLAALLDWRDSAAESNPEFASRPVGGG